MRSEAGGCSSKWSWPFWLNVAAHDVGLTEPRAIHRGRSRSRRTCGGGYRVPAAGALEYLSPVLLGDQIGIGEHRLSPADHAQITSCSATPRSRADS
jgi:hypothetical protein